MGRDRTYRFRMGVVAQESVELHSLWCGDRLSVLNVCVWVEKINEL